MEVSVVVIKKVVSKASAGRGEEELYLGKNCDRSFLTLVVDDVKSQVRRD